MNDINILWEIRIVASHLSYFLILSILTISRILTKTVGYS